MKRVQFSYNLPKDAWSWVSIAKDKNLWGLDWKNETAHIPKELMSKILKSKFSKAEKITRDYIKNNPQKVYRNAIIKTEIQALERSWGSVEDKYFKVLSEITQKPIFSNSFNCFFTSGFMCPYNEKENWFMVSMLHSLPFSITTICHEVLHLQFLHYYKSYLVRKGLTKDQIEDLKESLTFLLNEPEFNQIILVQDFGYPEHMKLRNKLRKIWLKNKDFQELLDKAIDIIKK